MRKEENCCDMRGMLSFLILFFTFVFSNLTFAQSTNKFVCKLEDLNYDKKLYNNIKSQACEMIKKSIDSVKYNIRPLNRLVKNSSAFNLLACDTMLDDTGKLHLIEINRGPDLFGLHSTIGEEKITNIFTELFDIVVDGKETNLTYFNKHTIMF